ncbi:hypothetical protein [Leeuwenhoekiella parthenopeia]|uniref:DUF4380 domain-containing protein n=1 Tax=Leeuwenhoekiella parthenopeia TaxID=2890320 RepID=A0ABS8GMR7_9FLAO|nr:hypothetical protein [Leeuwenhoekiella parthenopeia]MCC4211260.1 hypothetical protein [Leeuwenhoekiella parthenopeia]
MNYTLLVIIFSVFCLSAKAQRAQYISAYEYEGCILLENKNTRVILNPNLGGSVLEYSLHGKNILFENPKHDGRIWKGGEERFEVPGGRMDVGPEKTTPFRASFFNKWQAKITGKLSATMTSPIDTVLGLKLIREFILDSESSRLTCTQTIENTGNIPQAYAHWSRTLAKGGGICLIPIAQNKRLPQGYALYRDQQTIDFNPVPEKNIRKRNGILEILGPTSVPKFAIESDAGWIAYIHQNDLLFIKTFPVYPDKLYGDMLSNQVSIWYYKNEKCEIEPLGPLEVIKPGQRISFTETWDLLAYEFPKNKLTPLNQINGLINYLK